MFKNKINLLTTLISVMLISTLVLTGCGNSLAAPIDMETLKYAVNSIRKNICLRVRISGRNTA